MAHSLGGAPAKAAILATSVPMVINFTFCSTNWLSNEVAPLLSYRNRSTTNRICPDGAIATSTAVSNRQCCGRAQLRSMLDQMKLPILQQQADGWLLSKPFAVQPRAHLDPSHITFHVDLDRLRIERHNGNPHLGVASAAAMTRARFAADVLAAAG
eukprot:CAMPEP_0206299462 /NCGR_PEP_ID=MMETSP0106_2-20121207/7201_1 /ASSEMBLY_ACC=CAM_ASM_000206 /TAXON_ID=81532 /ORGANISM="Acanthoeca-like sp., Strain 10tr" /LENGTH=155 /DNA_ID=CAMNT_0053730161 /DNA_START=137 /DNA_END=601 /DNA_ORIENTATION=-